MAKKDQPQVKETQPAAEPQPAEEALPQAEGLTELFEAEQSVEPVADDHPELPLSMLEKVIWIDEKTGSRYQLITQFQRGMYALRQQLGPRK